MRLVVDLQGTEIEISETGAYPWLAKVGNLYLAARAGHLDGLGVGESASLAVELDNEGKQAAELLGYCLRAPATLYDDADDEFFYGLIQSIAFGPTLTLTIEAGDGNLLDSEPLPLRTTRALGDYSEDAVLQHILGDWTNTQFPLIRLAPTRYFAADHVMTIAKSFTAGAEVFGWERVLGTDDAGKTWTEVQFSAPIPEGTVVTATGEGKLDDDTGELIENPADHMRYVSRLSGRTDDFSQFRAECSALDLRSAVRIWERKSYKATQDGITQSVGAIWWPGGARLYPSAADPVPILDLDHTEVTGLKAVATSRDAADVLRLSYDWSDVGNRALHYLEMEASPRRYGGLSKEIVYPHLRTPANAEAVGRPVLQRMAGEKYDVTFETTNMTVRPGMWVRPVDHPEWLVSDTDPVVMVLTAEPDQDIGSVNVSGEAIVGESTVTITAYAVALPPSIPAGISVSVRDGVATFTITDREGRAIKGARLSLDGAAPKTSDAQGQVRFSATAGAHELAVEAPGMVAFTVNVTL